MYYPKCLVTGSTDGAWKLSCIGELLQWVRVFKSWTTSKFYGNKSMNKLIQSEFLSQSLYEYSLEDIFSAHWCFKGHFSGNSLCSSNCICKFYLHVTCG